MSDAWTSGGPRAYYLPEYDRRRTSESDFNEAVDAGYGHPQMEYPGLPGAEGYRDIFPYGNWTQEPKPWNNAEAPMPEEPAERSSVEELGQPDVENRAAGGYGGARPQATGYAAPVQPRQSNGLPPMRMVNGQAMIVDNDGNPVTSLTDYHRAVMGSQPKGYDQRAENLKWNSGLLREPQTPEQAGQLQQSIGERYRYLSGLHDMAQQDENLTHTERARVSSHLIQQMGSLATHFDKAQQSATRQKAMSSGLHPEYGTPQGPELDPQSRQKLQEAEQSLRMVRDDPSLSAQQKVVAAQALRSKMDSLDPAGRYRNGQQPMTPVQQFVAQNVHVMPEHGIALAIDSKGTPHWHTLPQPKEAKAEKHPGEEGFYDQPFHVRQKQVGDYAEKYGISHQEALQDILHQQDMMHQHRPGPSLGIPGHPDTPAGRAAQATQQDFDRQQFPQRPTRRTVEQIHKEELAAQKVAEDRAIKAEKTKTQAEKDKETKLGHADEADQHLQQRLRTQAQANLKYHYGLKNSQAAAAAKQKNKEPPEKEEPSPEEIETAFQGLYKKAQPEGHPGSKLSHAAMARAVEGQFVPAIEKAKGAGDEESAHYIENLRRLATAHPRGPDTMSPEERGHWLLGHTYLRKYDPSVGNLPDYDTFKAVPPR